MATKKKPAPEGAETAGTLQAAWPFPKVQTTAVQLPADDAELLESKKFEVTGVQVEVTPAAAERIRVDAIDLYTDPSKNQVERVALEQLLESPFNPRTRFDEKALQALAETVRDVGVMQALLVRPVAIASGWQIARGGEPVQAYEIVFGHRRYRAAKIAGVATVPVIVRQLTDAQAAQLQAIENLQREDLDALDEAEGYAHYIKVHGVSKDQLADEVGLSRTHVYSRLKLLNGVPAVQQALRAGEIESEVALYISRIPHAKLQEKALASLQSNGMQIADGGKPSVRRIREFLRERFTLNLSEALFDAKDAQLLADAGACTDCPKRTGNSPEHQDLAETTSGMTRWGRMETDRGQPNLCTDPECFEAKKKAHLANKAAALQAKGKIVITGGKARLAIGADGQVKGGYIALKDVKAELAKARAKKGNEGIEVVPVIIQNPRDGKTVEAVKIDDLQVVGVKVKASAARSGGGYNYEEENRRRAEERQKEEARAAAETKVNVAILGNVRTAAAAVPRTAFDLQLVAHVTYQGVEYNARSLLATLHGFQRPDQLAKKIGQMSLEQLTTLMLDCALVGNVVQRYGRDKPEALLAAAKHYGIDVTAIRKEVAAMPADTKTQDLLQTIEQYEEEEAEA